ncbi:MAG: DUF4350 domain-containing protein [Candidatus Eremiobacteraeota bacterium]|nr:DUF4350 domain-containing protein [Candidatus Eremiobacteraeota bacterium]
MRRRSSGDVLLGIGALVLIIFLTLARASQEPKATFSTPASFDTGRYGYRAFYELLRREGVPVTRFTKDHHFLNRQIGTLVLAQSAFDALAGGPGVSRNDLISIKDWIRHGGTLVVLAPPYGSPEDTLVGIPASKKSKTTYHEAVPFSSFPGMRGVSRIAGNFANLFALDASQKAVPLLQTHEGLAALTYHLGPGKVIVFTDPGIFSNGLLTHENNAQFAVQLFAALPAPVAFDETVHGYGEGQSLWEALPWPVHVAVFFAAFALLLGVVGNIWRFAPPLVSERQSERDSSAYITSMANLLARARASGKAMRDDADCALRAVRRACGVSDRTKVVAFLARLQDPHHREAVLELDRLRDLEKPSDAELLRAGILCSQLRKDFGL